MLHISGGAASASSFPMRRMDVEAAAAGFFHDDDDDGGEEASAEEPGYSDEEEDPMAAVADLEALPLGEVLLRAAPLLAEEDTRLPAAFALLERLKVRWLLRSIDRPIHPSIQLTAPPPPRTPPSINTKQMPAAEDDPGTAPGQLLRLLARFVGYHRAVLEGVLEALSLVERPAAIVETLPLLVVGAGAEEVARVVAALQRCLQDDLSGLLLPVLGALFDLPLTPKLRREALGLAEEALGVVADADVPVVVRTLLRTLDEGSGDHSALLARVRRECAALSPSATAVLVEVLGTALATSPKVGRLLLAHIRAAAAATALQPAQQLQRQQQQQQQQQQPGAAAAAAAATDPQAPPPLSLVDALVLVLLFPCPQHHGLAQDALGRAFAAAPAVLGGHLLRLADHTAEPLWAVLASPLADLAEWLLLSGGGPRPDGPAARDEGGLLSASPATREHGRALAARVLMRLFQLHPALRDDLLGFLLALCVPSGLLLLSGRGGGVGEDGRSRQLAALLPMMRASRAVLAGLAHESPRLLLPYAGMCGGRAREKQWLVIVDRWMDWSMDSQHTTHHPPTFNTQASSATSS